MSCMGKLHFRPGLGKMTGAGRQNGFLWVEWTSTNEQACAAGSRCKRCRKDERISPRIQSESRSLYARSVRKLENSRTYFSSLQFIPISPGPRLSECHPPPGRDRAEGEEMRSPHP